MYILGISAYYHDSAAVIMKNGRIIAAVQEERFSRKKHDSSFPENAIIYCLNEAKIDIDQINYVAFYDKPLIKFERLLETYLTEAPRGFRSFLMSIPIWLKEKLFLKETLSREFESLYANLQNSNVKKAKQFKTDIQPKLMFAEHHQSHASSAYYPSPFDDAAILTVDGVGEWATTSIAHGKGNQIKIIEEIHFPHSLGLLYSAFTYYTGFKVNSGEYKVMGLAPYGNPKYASVIKEHLIDIKDDGSFRLDMSYFNYTAGLTMTSQKFHDLFGAEPRESESELTQMHMDLAASIQQVTEEVMISLARRAKEVTGSSNLCMAGGVALNCVANGKLSRKNIFKDVWVQPAAGDAGGALGAAMSLYFHEMKSDRPILQEKMDGMQGSYLGPAFSTEDTKKTFSRYKAKYRYFKDEEELLDLISGEISLGKVVGWHYGRMEFGPRALGARSIIGDPRNPDMQKKMNLKIKYRESFRPFAPSVLSGYANQWFDIEVDSPYMLHVAKVAQDKCIEMDKEQEKLFGIEKLNVQRSQIPAITHVDYSARIQTVHKETNPRYYKLISEFYNKTGCPVVVNTSFNVRGEPIVCTPDDSYRCFMRTEMDILVVDNYVLYKEEQPKFKDQGNWQEEFELD